jgi:hypothetical protein
MYRRKDTVPMTVTLGILALLEAKAGPRWSTPGSGMTERAEALGGTLAAGARPEGGFSVRARLPLHDRSQPGRDITEQRYRSLVITC